MNYTAPSLIILIFTFATPSIFMVSAAFFDRSKILPFMKGPLSVTFTITDNPFDKLVTWIIVPNGMVLWAEVNPFMLNFTPLAVLRP